MFDFEIAQYLYRVSFLYEKICDREYKARAYFKAALSVDGYSKNIECLYHASNLKSLPSIGVSIEKNISEIIETQHLLLIDSLLGEIPYTIFELYEHASFSDKLIKKIIEKKVFSFPNLSEAIRLRDDWSLSELRTLETAVQNYQCRKFQYAQVFELADELVQLLESTKAVDLISLSDGLFLHKESLACGNIICTAKDMSALITAIKTHPLFHFVNCEGQDLFLERFDIPFHIKVLSDHDYTVIMNKQQSEAKKLGIGSHRKKKVDFFYGDLHLHTNWSDGIHTIEQMHDQAVNMGYRYLAITDHSQSLKPSGMSELDTLKQIKKIREFNKKNSKIPVLAGIEVDILADGTLDLPESILKEFDIVIASIHSHFNQSPLELWDRISKALSNPYVNIFAHPTGKLLGRPSKPTVKREELPIFFDKLLQLCLDQSVALEINCFPERFDLSMENAIAAIKHGVKISIGTDAHSAYHMESAKYVLDALKFMDIPASAVLNCMPYNSLKKFLAAKRDASESGIDQLLEEKFKDFAHYFGNNEGIISGKVQALGIDLTGSEKKASGFAVLSGTTVETALVLSDDEMVERIKQIKPEVISIDSPLALPKGRCCGDKNCPECGKMGIMRDCELLLRHFGIGVYPCLIDSMVDLTTRGINLAKRLRELGFMVIESYPGVAQDLLHIPRKRRGLELLLSGMRNFGIEGMREGISHDEADAITSALVGYFYLNNNYVGMGNEEEGYLIVPKLETSLSGKGIVIGLVGRIYAGKTTMAEYMRFKHGFQSMRFSQVIEEKYHTIGRKELQRKGNEIRSVPERQKELSDIMLSRIKPDENYIIDGLRQEIDYENLSSALKDRFQLLHIDSSQKSRYARYCKLCLGKTLEDFKETDEHLSESSIEKVALKSDDRIVNNKGYVDFIRKIETYLEKISE